MARLPLAASLAALALALADPPSAEACGGFFSRQAGALPNIAVERVLMIHDEATGIEHFIREIAFDKVDRPFGFVIPTPSRPSVLSADGVGWSALERAYPMFSPNARGAPQGFGSGAGRLGGAGVTVLEAKPLGSFAAYVVEATEPRAMKEWLAKNQFVTTPSSEAWLAHYIKIGFFFVALRFDPGLHREKQKRDWRRDRAETLRISFLTPVPYYPYLEPDRDDVVDNRILALWLVTRGQPKIPVALVREGDQLSYRRPWREGPRTEAVTREALGASVGEEVWKKVKPRGDEPLRVQVFEDQKRSRRGFGDVVLVPEQPRADEVPLPDKLGALLPILDPGLEAP